MDTHRCEECGEKLEAIEKRPNGLCWSCEEEAWDLARAMDSDDRYNEGGRY